MKKTKTNKEKTLFDTLKSEREQMQAIKEQLATATVMLEQAMTLAEQLFPEAYKEFLKKEEAENAKDSD